jgi:hypothetical protein
MMQRMLRLSVCFVVIVQLFSAQATRAQYRWRYSGSTVSSLTCATNSITGAATDACTVALTSAASRYGVVVQLVSNNAALKVPASVTVPAGATKAGFTATASSVTSLQTVSLTATAGRSSTFTLQLNPIATTAKLTVNSTSIAFGNVSLNTTATQSLILTSTGSAAVTISGVSVSGSGFSISGVTTPLTLGQNQTATLNVMFKPTVTSTDVGTVTITSNSSTGSQNVVSLSGTGQSAAHQVQLSWSAPAQSSDPVAGYRVYRANSGSSSYQQLNSTAVSQTSFLDSVVQSGQTYNYIVRSLDTAGNESVSSNMASASIP